MTCKDCIHKSVCYRTDRVPYDHADKCGDYIPERTGHWIIKEDGNTHCSVCGGMSYKYNFCPCCGADMRGNINADSN